MSDVQQFYTKSNFEIKEEVREGGEKQVCIQGYALIFDSLSEDMGFREIIKKGALEKTDFSDVILTFNHSNDNVLARNNKTDGIGSLKLTVDDKGLFFEGIPTGTTYSKDLIENIQAGIIDKCSFRFSMDYGDNEAQTWDWDSGTRGYDVRFINKIKKISDVSLVTNAAYNSTSANTYLREKADSIKELEAAKNNEIEKLKLEIELM